MKTRRRRLPVVAALFVLAGVLLVLPAFASPPFPYKCGFGFGCGVPGVAIHQAANNFEPAYYLFGQSGYGGFGKLYIPANGDKMALGSPAAPTLSAATGGTLVAGTYRYRVTASNAYGEALPSPATAITLPVGTTTGSVNISWTAVMNAAQYNIYGRSGAAGSLQRLATVTAPTLNYTDNGSATPSGALPTTNATIPKLVANLNFGLPPAERESYVEANCLHPSTGYKFRARTVLTGLAINNPAGLINATAPATKLNPSDFPGTLGNPRFSVRWFPSTPRAPTASPPPQGPPAEGATFSTPSPGEIGTGNISGTNNPPSAQDQTNFCTFRENLFVEGRATFEVKVVVVPDPNNPLPETGKFNLIVKDATGATVRTRLNAPDPASGPDAGNSTNDGCRNPPAADEPLCAPPNRPAGPDDPGGPDEHQNGDNWPRIEPSSYLGNYQVSVTAGTGTLMSNYDTQISCNDNANGSSHVVAGAGPEGVGLPPGANVHVVCTVTNTRKPVLTP